MPNDATLPDFRAASTKALLDPQLRANFRRAMDGLMAKRAAVFPDPAEWTRTRALGAAIRAKNLGRLPELLAGFGEGELCEMSRSRGDGKVR